VVETTLSVTDVVRKELDAAGPDVLRAMMAKLIAALMGAEADAICGAAYGEVCEERTNSRNGYRPRPFDTRVGTLEVAIPKLRKGSYFPDWLLTPRRRAEKALTSVVATSYLLGVSDAADGEAGGDPGHRPASTSCRSRRSPSSRRAWTSRWRRFGTGRWMAGRTPMCGSTR